MRTIAMGRRARRAAIVVVVAVVLGSTVFVSRASAAELGSGNEPYCGLYALYGAARLLGREVTFEDLLSPKFLGAPEGSSSGELLAAASALELDALIASDLTLHELQYFEPPVILHVRSDRLQREPDHWILWLGSYEGGERIVDGAQGVVLVPPLTLLSRWDGLGIAVADQPVRLLAARIGRLLRAALTISVSFVAALLIAGVCMYARRRLPRLVVDLAVGPLIIILLSGVLGIWWSTTSHGGLFAFEGIQEIVAQRP